MTISVVLWTIYSSLMFCPRWGKNSTHLLSAPSSSSSTSANRKAHDSCNINEFIFFSTKLTSAGISKTSPWNKPYQWKVEDLYIVLIFDSEPVASVDVERLSRDRVWKQVSSTRLLHMKERNRNTPWSPFRTMEMNLRGLLSSCSEMIATAQKPPVIVDSLT